MQDRPAQSVSFGYSQDNANADQLKLL